MSCKTPQTITQTILCAKVCYKKMTNPTAKMLFNSWSLNDDSTYFDDNSNRQAAWFIYTENMLFKEIEYGGINDIIPDMTNGSTYGSLILGLNNSDILSYLESIPNTQIPSGTKFTIFIEVKDSNGLLNENLSNKYVFTK